jgi:hypothetical protein
LVKAQQEMLKEKDEYITKLKGSSSVNSTASTTDAPQRKLTLPEGLAEKFARFSPQGRKLATA